jgi:peptide/nickel transport system ATP-binding protein
VPPLLDVRDLSLSLPCEGGRISPVDGVSFCLSPGECVGLVGESGCGKSLTALTLLGLSRRLPRSRADGQALWAPQGGDSEDLLKQSESRLQSIRGGQIAMVFQDPLSSLNPLYRVDYQIGEVLARHMRLRGKRAHNRAVELLQLVGVPQPEARAVQYPHQLSGGLRQRALLAMALAGEPQLLIADEPTTALDVTVQAQILHELRHLQRQSGLAILFITHDLGVIAQLCSRVLVMYAGRIVERAPVDAFFSAPRHPYSQALLASLPGLAQRDGELSYIAGSPPHPGSFPAGCRFHPRCPLADARCREQYPPEARANGHIAACWKV